ncbi:MAG: methyltransferase domain-containing protein [Rhodocyclaceae bacterium]|nr:methyltransferase domain-containing protein [Rhodocyclaceae bacterium]MDZ4215032.1 methyltransferase domain-containing protein [Rhodocyclaceae bacterium]
MTLQKKFAKAAASYDSAAVLAREVGRRLGERLGCVRLAPQRVADVGCATGDGIADLQRRYPAALPLAVDYALPMLTAVRARSGWLTRLRGRQVRLVNADVRALPVASGSLDLVWSNLMLHWLGPDGLQTAFSEMHRTLASGGLLQFALLGPDTLKELRTAGAPIHAFQDMHDIGDMLLAAGFSDPVMEMEMLTLTYRSPRAFLADQRHLGVRDVLLGQLSWQRWRQVLAAWPRVDGVLPARFEIVYGHAWKLTAPDPATRPETQAVMRFHPPHSSRSADGQ